MALELLNRYGRWAVVTGASSGIGHAFARRLAAEGVNLVLVARREAALKGLADELERVHRIDTRVVAADLSTSDFIEPLTRATDDLDVGLVVSNAGAADMGALVRVPVESLQRMLSLNTDAHLLLAHHFGNRFRERGRGGLLFVGSTAGLQGTPFAANYAGAKAYVHTMGQALNYELRDANVDVSVVAPGPTETPALTNRSDIDLNQMPAPVMSTERLVDVGLKGLVRNKPLVVAGAPNRMMDWMGRVILGRRGARAMWGALMSRQLPPHLSAAPSS